MKTALAAGTSPRRIVLGVVLLVLLVAVLLMLYLQRPADQVPPRENAESQEPAPLALETAELANFKEAANLDSDVEIAWSTSEDELVAFSPERVLNNPECLQSPALGPSSDIAVVVLPAPEGARFAVVGSQGILHSGALPFMPMRYEVARRRDGSVVTLFGHHAVEDPEGAAQESPFPAYVYLGDQAIFKHDNLWNFGLAADGSSFFAIEPLAGETSRLAIHNLDKGSERHYDLGDLYQRFDPPALIDRISKGEVVHTVRYSVDYGEVMIFPSVNGIGFHHFFPTTSDGRKRRKINVPDDIGAVSSVFASSEEAYFAFRNSTSAGPSSLTRRAFSWSSGVEQTDIWQRTTSSSFMLSPIPFGQFSADGSRMFVVMGDTVEILDTSSGETVLHVPADVGEAQSSERSGASAPGATVGPLIAAAAGYFIGNQLLVFQTSPPQDGAFEFTSRVVDFEIIQPGSDPVRPAPFNYSILCAPGDSVIQGLQEHNGRLTFLTNRG